MRVHRTLTMAGAAVGMLVLAACGNGTEEPATGEAAPADDPAGELDEEQQMELEELLGQDGDLDLPDPNEQVEDGFFRGQGIILPIPEGFEIDPGAFMQGLVAAVTEDGLQQIAGQAVDTDTLEQPLSLDELVAANEEQFGEASSNEEADVEGASQARQLLFEDLPSQIEDQPDLSLLLLIAENGDGEVAVFNYVAPADEYDQDEAEEILASAGFDPDSSPPEQGVQP